MQKTLSVKSGDWLRNKLTNFKKSATNNTNFINADIWELWEPQKDEYCVFFNNSEEFIVSKFNNKCNDKYKDNKNNYFNYCIPCVMSIDETLEYIQKEL